MITGSKTEEILTAVSDPYLEGEAVPSCEVGL
jgi:hypothetical protein